MATKLHRCHDQRRRLQQVNASQHSSTLSAIHAKGVVRRFGDKVAVAGMDLDVGPGITGLLGPNGSGKSTFLRCLYGVTRPDAGEIVVGGARLVGDGVAVRLQAAYAPGEIALYGELRADEHLQWFLRGRESNAWQRALEYAQRLELPLRKRVRTYSHGMKRQLMLCAALAPQVPVRILDEPTEGLDPSKRGAVLQLLQEDAARGTAILLSSHHLGEVDRVCARLVFVQAGRIIANETAATVRERAARLVRLSFAATVAEDSVKQTLQSLGGATLSSMVVEDQLRVSAQVAGEPREWLARALDLPALPAPTTIEHGRLSLAELYRELYGVEGC